MACKNIQSAFLGSDVCPVSGHFTQKRKIGNSSVKCALVEGGDTLVADNMPIGVSSLIVRRSFADRKFETKEKKEIGNGKFGRYGGKFVPETLMSCLSKLEAEFQLLRHDPVFQVCIIILTLYYRYFSFFI